jgi:hypothetical protein
MRQPIPWAITAVIALAGCDRLEPGAQKETSAPVAAPRGPDVRPFVGLTLTEFTAAPEMAQFTLAAQGLSEADQARFMAAHAQASPAIWLTGGGAGALVFFGCGAAGCASAASVMAIDGDTGESFVGVRDADGAIVLAPNLRLEALLRLGSVSGRWDDPNQRQPVAGP